MDLIISSENNALLQTPDGNIYSILQTTIASCNHKIIQTTLLAAGKIGTTQQQMPSISEDRLHFLFQND